MSDIAPNERPTDEQMRRNAAMEAARWDARDLLLRREPMEIFDAGFEAGLAAAYPVPEDAAELRDVLGELVRLKIMKPLMELPATDPRRPMSLPEYEIAKEVAWARAGEILSRGGDEDGGAA